jgi:hypothetical protein
MAEPTQTAAEPRLPRITIQFCTQCKWMLRAAYVRFPSSHSYPTLPYLLQLCPSCRIYALLKPYLLSIPSTPPSRLTPSPPPTPLPHTPLRPPLTSPALTN